MAEWLMARERHDDMLRYYRQQDWNLAANAVYELQGEFDGQMDHYYEVWLERIAEMREKTLPEGWDGTYVATSK
jgi:hypothetical protein